MKAPKPRLFIASAGESTSVAHKVQTLLQKDAEVTVWNQDVFKLNDYPLERLMEVLGTFDFAVFIFTPDDVANIRQRTYRIVRDNVIFELGLFTGRLGRRRCFIVAPQDKKLHLPTDLLGLNVALFEADRQDGNITAALGPACEQIRDLMKEFGPRTPGENEASQRLIEEFKTYLLSQVEKPVDLKRRVAVKKLPPEQIPLFGEED